MMDSPAVPGFAPRHIQMARGCWMPPFRSYPGAPVNLAAPVVSTLPNAVRGTVPSTRRGAIFLLKALISTPAAAAPHFFPEPAVVEEEEAADQAEMVLNPTDKPIRYGVLDIETQLSALEVGGWHHAARMRASCVVLYDSRSDKYYEFVEGQVPMLLDHLRELDLVIGFNIKRFDYRVLSAYTELDFRQIPTLDILEKVKDQLGYRLSLDHLARVTLDAGKTADGLDALRWWKEGKMAKILEYCRSDVTITRDLFRFGRDNRYLLFQNKAKQIVRLPVSW